MLLEDCWYVAAWSHEIEAGKILGVQIMDTPLAIYRKEDGAVSVVLDRCPHRFAPLSLGRVEGDSIRCNYHGLRFNAGGACTEIPGGGLLKVVKPLRTFPVVEQDSWVWVWMGAPERADPSLVPRTFGLDDPAYHMQAAHLDYDANYMLINDNLCDLSHVDFVHEKTLGWATGGNWSTTKARVTELSRGVRTQRWFVAQPSSPTNPTPVDTWNTYDYFVPGVFVMESKSYPHGTAEQAGFEEPDQTPQTYRIEQQAVTPISANKTRYFYASGFDARMPEKLLDGIFKVVMAAFAEDKQIIEGQQKVLDLTPEGETMSFIPHDRGLVIFRRTLDRLIQEQSTQDDALIATDRHHELEKPC